MGSFGDFYNKNKKKLSKEEQAKKASKMGQSSGGFTFSQPEIIARGKKKVF